MKIKIYVIGWNEEAMLPHFYLFYKKRFPEAEFVLYDNYSEDNTVEIAKSLGFEVRYFGEKGVLSDSAYLEIKNNCWKEYNGWVLICDMDEWLDIDIYHLSQEQFQGTTIISSEGYNMCNKQNLLIYENINTGIRDKYYDKNILFDSRKIKEVNYAPGAHFNNFIGEKVFSKTKYKLKHMKFILGGEFMANRYEKLKERMSQENKEKGWGIQYLQTREQIIEAYGHHLDAAKNIYQ